MDPGTIALLSAAAGAGSKLWGMYGVKGPGALPEDFWKKHYSPERARATVAPAQQALRAELARLSGESGERWGGRGLMSSEGATAERRKTETVFGKQIASLSAAAHAKEIDTAGELGLASYVQKYQEAMGKRSQWGQMGSQLLRIGGQHLGSMETQELLNKMVEEMALVDAMKRGREAKGIPWESYGESWGMS